MYFLLVHLVHLAVDPIQLSHGPFEPVLDEVPPKENSYDGSVMKKLVGNPIFYPNFAPTSPLERR